MTFPTPDPDPVAQSQRAIRKVESDKKQREARRMELADDGLLMVAPGMW